MVSSYNDVHSVVCKHCGVSYDILLDLEDLRRWSDGEGYIHDILAYLSAAERELLISGTCDDCWNNMFGSCGDDEDECDGDDEEDDEEDPRLGAHLKMLEECDTTNSETTYHNPLETWEVNPNLSPSASWCNKCNDSTPSAPILEHQCADGNSGTFVMLAYSSSEGVLVKCNGCDEIYKVCINETL